MAVSEGGAATASLTRRSAFPAWTIDLGANVGGRSANTTRSDANDEGGAWNCDGRLCCALMSAGNDCEVGIADVMETLLMKTRNAPKTGQNEI